VAVSRDLAVALCQIPYFLLLDAHMRLYNTQWSQRIMSELKADEKALLCCQTKPLIRENGLFENIYRQTSFGACIDFYEGKWLLEPLDFSRITKYRTTANYSYYLHFDFGNRPYSPCGLNWRKKLITMNPDFS
jgi:hypothetical protein